MRKKEVEKMNLNLVLGIVSIILLVISLTLLSAIFDMGGSGSNTILKALKENFGIFTYLMPLILIYLSIAVWRGKGFGFGFYFALGLIVLIFSTFGILDFFDPKLSGVAGQYLFEPLSNLIGRVPALLSFFALAYVGLMIMTGRKSVVTLPEISLPNIKLRKEREETIATENIKEEEYEPAPVKIKKVGMFSKISAALFGPKLKLKDRNKKQEELEEEEYEEEVEEEEEDIRDQILKPSKKKKTEQEEEYEDEEIEEEEEVSAKKKVQDFDYDFTSPPAELLKLDQGRSNGGDTKSKGKIIQSTLAEFGIPVEIAGVTVGPTVTQFRVKTPQGFKVKSIMNYHDNLQMNLSAESVHIEAPIPGQSVVGVSIPNKEKQMLGLGTMIDSEDFRNSGNLSVVIGKDVVGKPVYGDIESMPHLLIAGATKSGKSVTIQNIITSLLYKNSPDDLKLMIIDPKKVEFTVYKNLPHLYTPVITDAKNAIKCLNWAVQEMERRYDYFAENYEGVQNISDYNKKILYPAIERERRKKNPNFDNLPEKFPYVVIIFDEFNDFMINYGKEITSLITSLTQKARAAGMHLILATQRPDVKVINGTIKANIPARIALRTSSRIDSQTIIDQGGAEDLLGNGDMLFLNPGKRPARVQAPYVSTEEVKNVISYIKSAYYGYEPELIDLNKTKSGSVSDEVNVGRDYGSEDGDDEEEELYSKAKEYIIMTGRASATNLQSKFGLGFAKANRLIMMMEERGVVSPLEGNKRRVLAGREDSEKSDEDE